MTTQLTSTFILPEDVLLIPVEELTPATRERLDCAAGDVAITRPLSRRPSSVVDANGAKLIELFRAPSTVVDAVVRFSRATNTDPRAVLESAFPLVERLVTGGVLLPSGDERARPIEHGVARGDIIGGFTIIDRVHILEDVEIHRARASDGTFAALKIARAGHAERLGASLARESAILRRLDGHVAPRVLAVDLDAALPYMATEWCAGVPPTRALDQHRTPTLQSRRSLIALCIRIAEAYADLHERGVLHGDVHDGNVLVGRDGEITLLDFGLASVPTDSSMAPSRRGGIPEYYDPQFAAAQRSENREPPLDAGAEQYSMAVLLYTIVTGRSYLELSMRRDEALRQIVEDMPLSFETAGLSPWPELEAVLARALSKDPACRHPSMRELARSLSAISVALPESAGPVVAPHAADRRRFVTALVDRLAPDGPLYEHGLPAPPLCSINNGAAGIAYALYRMALAREDATLLAHADAWVARGKSWASEPEAWYTRDGLISRKEIGPIALYHTATGLHCVETLIALATGDESRAERCAMDFIAASRKRTTNLDLTLGTAGLVVGATLMLEASSTRWPKLRKRATSIVSSIEQRINSFAPIADESAFTYLGIAHGWSGLLWTLMRWHRATGDPMPEFIEARLRHLSELATPRGRGLAWAWSTDARDIGSEPHPAPTWCNGTSGHVHTWLEAHAAFGNERYLDLAHAAAWNVWDDSRDDLADACCGLVGRAYALLAFSRRTGDTKWRRRAELLADRALDASTPESAHAHRLYKGALGVALLLEELESAPDDARMPVFESEGWRWGWQ